MNKNTLNDNRWTFIPRKFVAMKNEKFIDVEQIIASRNSRGLKRTPKFLIRYLKRIVHQEEINAFIKEHKHLKNAEWCKAVVDYMNIKIDVKGIERIPKSGKIVIAMNHPLGGMDAMILVSALKDHRSDLKFIVNDLLMSLENMNEMFVGVNKLGKNKGTVREQIKDLFASDKAVCIFPAGMVSRKQKGSIKDLVWKKTFVTYSKEFDRTIVPIYIDGRLSNFFYRLARLRKFLGIKVNIEMLYLANELFKQKNRTMRFVVGEPILGSELSKEKDDKLIAQEIKETVYSLQSEL